MVPKTCTRTTTKNKSSQNNSNLYTRKMKRTAEKNGKNICSFSSLRRLFSRLCWKFVRRSDFFLFFIDFVESRETNCKRYFNTTNRLLNFYYYEIYFKKLFWLIQISCTFLTQALKIFFSSRVLFSRLLHIKIIFFCILFENF